MLHAVAIELVLENGNLVIERYQQSAAQVVGADVLLDPVGLAVEAPFAPAGEIQGGFAQGLGGNGAGVNRDAADAPPAFDHQGGLVQLGGLDGGAASCRAAADDDEVVVVHGLLRLLNSAAFPAARCMIYQPCLTV